LVFPNSGSLGTPENVAQVAERAEAVGYDSLWTIELLLWPVKPRTPYPVTPNGLLPEGYKHSLDPSTGRCPHEEDHSVSSF
jgi:alkanesulfonate monooxygenase SsuD/methylene tetrahydromethanopterin reductase-like flavin-dependent oxidoreductase (luciferase family)